MLVDAPAKLNLSLRVLGKRHDGFHTVETLMIPLSGLADRLTFEAADAFELICDTPGIPIDGTNLVTRAARLYEQELGRPIAYRIRLEKSVPHGAGLGGGSSDAASTLLGLNALHDDIIPFEKLTKMGASLGSDVPFFFFDEACWCRGRGTQVEAAGIELDRQIILFKPAFSVSTEQAYKRWTTSQELADIPYGPQEIDGIKLVNDLERPVFEKHLFLAILKRKLIATEGIAAAMMSGSGSTIFAILNEDIDGTQLAEQIKSETDPLLWTWTGKLG